MQRSEIKICYNVLTGTVRILSLNGGFDYRRKSHPEASMERRVEDLVAVLRIVRRLRAHQIAVADARKKLIEARFSAAPVKG